MRQKKNTAPRAPRSRVREPRKRLSGAEAERSALPVEPRYRALIDMIPHGVQENDREGRITFSNRAHHRILGYDQGELIGKYIWDMQPNDAEKAVLSSYLNVLLNEQPAPVPYVTQSMRKDGSLVDLQIDWDYQRDADGGVAGFISIITDITDRKRTEHALLIKDRALESSVNAVAMSDLAGRLTYVNPSFLKMWAYASDREVLGRTATEFWQNEQDPASVIDALWKQGNWHGEMIACRREGATFPVELSASMVVDARGIPVSMMGSFIDITERQQAEAGLRHVNRLYAFLSQVNEAIVRIKEREALFPAICDVAVEYGKFRMAWIGLIDEGTGIVKPSAHAGQVEGYLQHLAITIDEQPAGRGPTGSALREDKLVICEDIQNDPRMAPWRDAALQRGYRSSAAVPFKLRGRVIGALNLYAAETGFFTDDERKLLEEIGIDISYALDAMEEESGRGRAEEALRRSESRYRELVENVPIWIWETDRTGRHIYTNSFVAVYLGYQPDEFLRCDMFGLIHPDDRETAAETARRAMTARRGWTGLVLRWKHKDGTWKYIESRGAPTLDADGTVIGLHGVDQDVTERVAAVDALRESEEKFRNLVEIASDWIWEVDEQGVYTYASPKVRDILGYEPEELMGKTPFYLMPTDEAVRVSGIFKRLRESRGPISLLENINLHKDGHVVVLETSCVPLLDAHGAVHGYRGIDRDITEHRRSEALLKDSEEKYRAIVESTAEWIWEMDLAGRFTFSNAACQAMLGYCPEELCSMSSMDLIHENDRADVLERLTRHVQERTGWTGWVLRWRHKNGEYRWLDCNASPILDVQGLLSGYRGSDRDITERKRAEERQAESERKYRNLFDAATDAIFILDLDGHFIDVNKTAYTRLGYTREEMLSLQVSQVDTPDHAARVRERMADIQGRGMVVFEAAHRRKDGSVMPVEVNARLLDYEGRKVYFSVIRDITERKKAEEEKLQMERRLLHAQKLESLGVLAGGIAHDFNNLLMAILGNLDMALLKLSPVSSARENIHQALQATHRSAELARQMLAYSGKGAFVVKRMDLSELVEENAHLLKASIPKNVVLKINLQQPLPAVDADPAQLQQVVMNLITNGSEAIGEQTGVITLSTGITDADDSYLRRSRTDEVPPAGRFVYLEVADTGCGMDAATRQRLFDPFFTTKTMGRGLGMSAILGIVRGHRGAIIVDSETGEGTTIRVLLPAAPIDAAPAQRSGTTAAASAGSTIALFAGTVLVVDDEEIVRDVCREMLSACGVQVLTAEDGDEALEVFRKEGAGIDCVLLDLSMPKKDGMAVCREMLEIRPDAKIILSSGYHDQEIIRRGSQEGLAGFIPKPYTLDNMMTVLGPVLKKGT